MKYLAAVLVSAAFLLPNLSYAATFEENRQALIFQLISLIQQEIASLQAQLVAATTQATSTPLAVSDTTTQITSITNALGSTMTQPAPQPLVPSQPVKPLKFSEFRFSNGRLVIKSNKLLAWDKMVLPVGVSITNTIFNATDGPFSGEGEVSNHFIGEVQGETAPVYVYESELAGAQGTFPVSVTDEDGQSATMTVSAN